MLRRRHGGGGATPRPMSRSTTTTLTISRQGLADIMLLPAIYSTRVVDSRFVS
jgi:hypothetical protein